jgi:uncharacterized protein YheU (UPF0270 family)
MIIPHEKLSADALQGLVEEFVSRDGTDSGYLKASLADRVMRVKRQLAIGRAVIVYDPMSKTCNIVLKEDM